MNDRDVGNLIHQAFRKSFTKRDVNYENWTLAMCGEVVSELLTYEPERVKLLLPHVMLWCLKNENPPSERGRQSTWCREDIVSSVNEYLDIGEWCLQNPHFLFQARQEFGENFITDAEITEYSSIKMAFVEVLSRKQKQVILLWLTDFVASEMRLLCPEYLEAAIAQWKVFAGSEK